MTSKGFPIMRNILRHRLSARLWPIAIPAALLLGGCTSGTTVLSTANPSRAPASDWADYDSLPVDVHGTAPGRSKADLAAMFRAYHPAQYASIGELPPSPERRMVLVVNPANTISAGALCDGRAHYPRGVQQGDSAYVTGALCDGQKVISTASAYILTKDQSPRDLAYNFNMIRDQLYQSLFPGANDPDRYYEGY